jgi:hypothetical protein
MWEKSGLLQWDDPARLPFRSYHPHDATEDEKRK